MDLVIIKLPQEDRDDFTNLWKDIRLQEGLQPEADLQNPAETDNFDGSGLVEWALPLTEHIVPIITALFGYLVAKRGELEIEKNGTKIRMKNMKAAQLKDVIKVLDENQ